MGALALGGVVTVPAPRAHAATPVEALLIGDSVLDAMAQSYGKPARDLLAARHTFILDAAGCRRLITTSCSIGSSPPPTNAITVLKARAGQYYGSLVVAAGYNDGPTGSTGMGAAVDTLVTEARRQGIKHIIWLTYRVAGTAGNQTRFAANNAVLRSKLSVYPDLVLADWNTLSQSMPASWFSADGVHLGTSAVTAMADLIADTLDLVHVPPPPPDRCQSSLWTGAVPPGGAPAAVGPVTGGLNRLDPPVRLGDTRGAAGKLGAGRVLTVPVAGQGGVPADATAVMATVTAVRPCVTTYLTVYPCGGGVPTTSVVNAVAGSVVANSVLMPLGNGALCVFTQNATDVLVDVVAWVGATGSATKPVPPVRLVDTRPGQAQELNVPQQRLAAGGVLAIDVGADAAVGADASMVSINLTAVGPSAGGYLSAFAGPCPTGAIAPPVTSTLNVAAGRTTAASATVGVVNGVICVYSSVATDVVLDLQAVHASAGDPLTAVAPHRLLDTRHMQPVAPDAPLTIDLDATSSGVPVGESGVVLNITAANAVAGGYLVASACGSPPAVSTINVVTGGTVANRAVVALAGAHTICLSGTATTDVVVDLEGWSSTTPGGG